ncbi:phosphate/phosphite/phosphonate ABC transporter substrate-binding protein, partial [Limosilactobacillus reuteri]
MKFKKVVVGAMAILATVSLAACSNNKKSTSASSEPKELNVEFVPSTQANKMEAKAKPLGTLLQKQLHIPVHVTV